MPSSSANSFAVLAEFDGSEVRGQRNGASAQNEQRKSETSETGMSKRNRGKRRQNAAKQTRAEGNSASNSRDSRAVEQARKVRHGPAYKEPPPTVMVCDAESANAACASLITQPRIAVDCEGVRLSRTGKLCLVQIACPKAVYFFDILEGGPKMFDTGLRDLLQSSKVAKVIHDCRQDCDALFHQHNVLLDPVIDTQVAFMVYRRTRRLNVGLPVSLKSLLKKYVGLSPDDATFKEDIRTKMSIQLDFWIQRPLPSEALQYARFDVIYLLHVAALLENMITDIDPKAWGMVVAESQEYAAMFRDDADGPRKAANAWSRMVADATIERADKARLARLVQAVEKDPLRTFKFDRAAVLQHLTVD